MGTTNYTIERQTTSTEAALEAVNRLLPELTTRTIQLTDADLRQMLLSSATRLYFMKVGNEIVGMASLCSYAAPTGRKYWIEDVVIAHTHRGQGLGKVLIKHLIEEVRKEAPATLMLTSRPSRTEANALYRSVGFEQKTTNVYTLKL